MASTIRVRGDRKDFDVRQGQTIGPYDLDTTELGTLTTARLTIRNGTLANPGSVVSTANLADTMPIVTLLISASLTRSLTPGNDYCYELEATSVESYEIGILEGMIIVLGEICVAP